VPLAEIPYVFCLTGVLCVASFAYKHRANKRLAALLMLYTTLCCAFANFIRPLAILLFIAILLWLALASLRQAGAKRNLPRAAGLIACCVLLFFGVGSFLRLAQEKVVGREPAGFAMGWNLLDGSNADALGKWNAEDNAIFSPVYQQVQRREITPDELHRELFAIGMERYTSRGLGNLPFWGAKIVDLWGKDEVGFTYPIRMKQDYGFQNMEPFYSGLRGFNNGFYMAMVLYMVCLLVKRFRSSFHAPESFWFVYLPLLYILGMVVSHMILEQGQRYSFPAVAMMALIIGLLSQAKKDDENGTETAIAETEV